MEYKIIASNDLKKLSQEVNEVLAQGWELHGTLVINPNELGNFDPDFKYHQVVVRSGQKFQATEVASV
jgi:hypothetical protein